MRNPRLWAVLIVALVVIAAGVWGGVALFHTVQHRLQSDTCTVGDYEIDTDQASVAAEMVGAVTRYPKKLPAHAAVLALAAALQESKLRNLAPGDGDRDSVGVLQQRPSQGWGHGKAAPLNNVGEATTEFLTALIKHSDWQTAAPADAIQEVQISADGSLYAQHVPEATALTNALIGTTPAGIACSFDKPTEVAPAATVAKQASTQLGIDTPRAGTADTVVVPGAGWQTAAWFVANADRLGIEQVAYAGKQWTRNNDWKTAPSASTAQVVATMYSTS